MAYAVALPVDPPVESVVSSSRRDASRIIEYAIRLCFYFEEQLSAHSHAGQQPPSPQPLPGVNSIIAVGSGKGGVGKTTLAVNLALALAKMGHRVGLLDADVYGPNVPLMLGISEQPKVLAENRIEPLSVHGLKVLSVG